MARIVITEFMDERAVDALRAKHDVLYDPKLVDAPARLHAEAAAADAIVVRGMTTARLRIMPAPILAPRPIVVGPTTTASLPISTSSPITTGPITFADESILTFFPTQIFCP